MKNLSGQLIDLQYNQKRTPDNQFVGKQMRFPVKTVLTLGPLSPVGPASPLPPWNEERKCLKMNNMFEQLKKNNNKKTPVFYLLGGLSWLALNFSLHNHPWIEDQGCENKGNDSLLEYLLFLKILCHEMCKEQNGK